ncbi:MAG: HAMP domain-containing histidine kinase [Patescibacteria group bacterium]|nr:HAMP domain-containing histidine kinase [Patescibacteria group bacterium]
MFQSARLKLTAWYLIIIMSISVLFSFVIYSGINVELRRFERFQERVKVLQESNELFISPPPTRNISRFDPEMIGQARTRLLVILGAINIAILGIAGGAGYFLAGRTLKPIKKMVDEQNRFVADASHEFRTPLTSLRSEIEVNLRNKNLALKDVKKLLGSNLEEVLNLQMLSDNLLELAQTEKPIDSSNFVLVSLTQSIDTAIRKLDASIKEKEIKIEKKTANVSIYGLPDRITELFIILLDNAVKYGFKKSKVAISVKKTDGNAQIKIKDNGTGIEESDLPFVFDRFYRASKSRSKGQVSGYGLGLSIARKIVDSHHGSISVESKVNKGTTFTVVLPLKQNSL